MRYQRASCNPRRGLVDDDSGLGAMIPAGWRAAVAAVLALSLLCGYASTAEPGADVPPAAAEALSAVLANLDAQARGGRETPAQVFQRSDALWADLQQQMQALGTAMAEAPEQPPQQERSRAMDAVVIDVARAYARESTAVHELLDRYGKPSPGSELKAVVMPPRLEQGDVDPRKAQAWLMLLMAPRTELADFARPRVLQALTQLRVRDALPILELRAIQGALDRPMLARCLAAMRGIDPALALSAYARCVARAGEAMAKRPEVRSTYVQAIRDAVSQDQDLAEVARALATDAPDAPDALVRDVFAAATAPP